MAVLPAPAAYRSRAGDETVLRVVPRSDDRVHEFYGDPLTRHKAQLVDLSTPQASLALTQARTSAFRVPLILERVARHQPSVHVVDIRHPA